MPLIIACLSQKGGVGKSTIARLIARSYAEAGWNVKIADFNTKQLTSVDWVAARKSAELKPDIDAQPYNQVSKLKRETADLVVVDGKPDSDQSSLEIARIADLVVIPTGLTVDDLKPQVMFTSELKEKGIARERLLIVLNKTTESAVAIAEARRYLISTGFPVAEYDLATKTGYQMAQNTGRAASETTFASLNERAELLAAEIANKVTRLTAESAA